MPFNISNKLICIRHLKDIKKISRMRYPTDIDKMFIKYIAVEQKRMFIQYKF